MNIFFSETKRQRANYTSKLLKYLISRQKTLAVTENINNADCVFVSVCDVSEIGLLREARKLGKPIVSGGMISMFPIMRLWSDYVCVGEAYEFIEKMAKIRRIEDLENFKEVSTQNKEGELNEVIKYELNPIIYMGKNAAYYYCGKGCPQKCKYCLISHTRKYQHVDRERFLVALKSIKKGLLYPMLSHFPFRDIPVELQRKLAILDVRVRDYVQEEILGKAIRTGIEFFTENNRRKFGKPISDEVLRHFLGKVKAGKKDCVLYFVAGLEDWEDAERFIDSVLPESRDIKPRLIFVFTYFDPQPFTPLAGFDIREKKTFDWQRFFKVAVAKNKGVRVHTMKYKAYSSWRTMMQRCMTHEEAEYMYMLRNAKDNERLIDTVYKKYPNLITGNGWK